MNILLVDDNPSFRMMVRKMIAKRMNEDVVIHECDNGDEALAAYIRERPQWVVMDIELGTTNGLAATRAILNHDPAAKIIVITQYTESVYRRAAQEAGAHAFLIKDDLSNVAVLLNSEAEFS